ncbi:MAG: hypothetical protein HYV68_01860, partial [Candidatus Taylorbacteria bacterium]|nr:hypothetical protein [Candidatus Taylorbacteria bacterium]
MRKIVFSTLLAALFPTLALAHQFSYGAIRTTLTVEGDKILSETRAPLDLIIDPSYADKQRALFEDVFNMEFKVGAEGRFCHFKIDTLTKPTRDAEVIFTGVLHCEVAA